MYITKYLFEASSTIIIIYDICFNIEKCTTNYQQIYFYIHLVLFYNRVPKPNENLY